MTLVRDADVRHGWIEKRSARVLRPCCCAALVTAAALFASLLATSTSSMAETRRAFLVGIQRYNDGFIQRLDRTVNDAKDLATDLEDAGFDKKNIKVVTDLKNRDAFDKEFTAFLKTIKAGDTVPVLLLGSRLRRRGRPDQLSAVYRSQEPLHLHQVAAERPGSQES